MAHYHQTREDRRHEAAGMRRRGRRYHQTAADRRHESEGMRREDRGRHRSSHGSHQTREDRRHESEGMRRYDRDDRRNGSRRYHEMDSAYEGMIHEDHYAPANLPQEVVINFYPKQRWLPEDINDTITRVDADIDDSVRTLHEHESNTMY